MVEKSKELTVILEKVVFVIACVVDTRDAVLT